MCARAGEGQEEGDVGSEAGSALTAETLTLVELKNQEIMTQAKVRCST